MIATNTNIFSMLAPLLTNLIQTPGIIGAGATGAAGAAAAGPRPSTLIGHYNNLSMFSEQAARMQDNNGNQISGAALFLGDEQMSTAGYRLLYGVEGFFNRGERDQAGDGGQGFSPAEFQQFASYYTSNSPGKAVLDFYPFLKQEGANYNSDDIEDELRAAGLDDLADEFNEEDGRNTDVTRMHYLMVGMDMAARNGTQLNLRNTVDDTGREVLDDLQDPESDRAQEFAQQKADKLALLVDPSVIESRQLIVGTNFDDINDNGAPDNADLQTTAFTPSGATGAIGLPSIGGIPSVIETAIPQLDIGAIVMDMVMQEVMRLATQPPAPTTFGTFNSGASTLFGAPQPALDFGNFGLGGLSGAGTFGGGGLVQLPNGQTVTTLEAQMLGLPV
jgi:hypothetical protein